MSMSPIDLIYPGLVTVDEVRRQFLGEVESYETLDPMPPISPLIDTDSFSLCWNYDEELYSCDSASHVLPDFKVYDEKTHINEISERPEHTVSSSVLCINDITSNNETITKQPINGNECDQKPLSAPHPLSPPVSPLSSACSIPSSPDSITETTERIRGKQCDRTFHQLAIVGPRSIAISKSSIITKAALKTIKGTQTCGRQCSKKFETLGSLEEHLDLSHPANFRPHKCSDEHCIWSIIGFHKTADCTRHMDTVHSLAKFNCLVCPKMFKRPDAVKRHMIRVHKNL